MIRSSRARTRHLNRLWFAQSTSLVGLQTGSVAVPLLAVDVLHADASQVALIGTVSGLPWLIAPVIGTMADHVNRKRLLVLSHLGRALLWLTIPAAYVVGVLTIQQLWLVAGSVGVLSVLFGVGYRTFLPTIVATDELGAANGKMAGTDAVARTAGPAVAGYLVQLIGASWTVLVQTVTLILAGVSTATIRPDPVTSGRPPNNRRGRTAGWWHGMVDGFRYLYRIRPLRWLTLSETAYRFCFDLCFAVVIVFFRTTLELSATMIGVIFSVGSLGGILGAMAANRLGARVGFDPTVKAAAVLRGVGLAILPLSVLAPGPVAVAVLIVGRGINAGAWSVYEVLANTYEQATLPDSHRGSATAASLWLGNGASTVGAAVAVAVASVVDTTVLLTATGIGAAAAGLISIPVNTAVAGRASR